MYAVMYVFLVWCTGPWSYEHHRLWSINDFLRHNRLKYSIDMFCICLHIQILKYIFYCCSICMLYVGIGSIWEAYKTVFLSLSCFLLWLHGVKVCVVFLGDFFFAPWKNIYFLFFVGSWYQLHLLLHFEFLFLCILICLFIGKVSFRFLLFCGSFPFKINNVESLLNTNMWKTVCFSFVEETKFWLLEVFFTII